MPFLSRGTFATLCHTSQLQVERWSWPLLYGHQGHRSETLCTHVAPLQKVIIYSSFRNAKPSRVRNLGVKMREEKFSKMHQIHTARECTGCVAQDTTKPSMSNHLTGAVLVSQPPGPPAGRSLRASSGPLPPVECHMHRLEHNSSYTFLPMRDKIESSIHNRFARILQ